MLPNGNVLVAGGYSCDSSGNCASLSSAEMYHPYFGYGTGYFSSIGNMTAARSGHTMTLLNNGQVLIAGGQNCTSSTSCTSLTSAEIYDPVAGTFTATGHLTAARFNATAAALNQGLVLIAGGFDGTNYPASAELYDPSTGAFSSTGSLNTPRANAIATALNNGQTLISGGSTCVSPGCPVSSAELYNPSAGTFASTGTMNVSRFNHSATLLSNGQVLIAGGYSACSSACTSDSTAELYDPTAGTFTSTSALTTARAGQAATLLPSGKVLVAGGASGGTTLASTDSYQPSTLTPAGLSSISVAPANASIPGRFAQQFVAVGTFTNSSTQTLRSAIWTSSNQSLSAITNDAGGTGFVYPVTTGASTITAAAGSVSGSTVMNTTTLLTSLSVTPQYPIVLLGQTQQLAAMGTYSDGSTQDLTTSVTWSSSNTSVATVPSATGLVTAVGGGNAVIYAKSGTVSAYTSLTVESGTPSITSLSATSAPVGTMIAISGHDFGSGQQSASVSYNGVTAPVLSWSDILIMTQVPSGATSGPVQVNVGGSVSNTVGFAVTAAAQSLPTIAGLSELIGVVGDTVTITGAGFGTSGTISFNGLSAAASSWTANTIVTQIPAGAQTGPVTVASSGQTSNSVTLTIIVAPTVITVAPGSGDVGTVVTISGNNFAAMPSGPVVFFNGSAVAPTNWTNTQIQVTVPKGTRTGPLTVKVGHASSNATAFSIVPTGSQALSISPANSTLYIGQTLNLSLNDDLEHNITGATWALSDNTLAQLSTSDPPVLTAEKAGTVTVTAAWIGLAASAQVTISASGATLPLGAVVCSLPTSTSTYTVLQIMQMVPSSGSTPDLVAVKDDGAGSIWLRGLSSACEQQWHTRVGSSQSGTVDQVVGETPDNLGGVIVLEANTSSLGLYPATNSLVRVDSASGTPTWRYDSPGALGSQNPPAAAAIDQNGYILSVEDSQISNGQYSQARLIKIDPTSGSQVASSGIPSSTYSFVADGCGYEISQMSNSTTTIAGSSGPISVGPDGSYYAEISWINGVSWLVPMPDTNACDLDDESYLQTTGTTTTQLMTISPAGSASVVDLPGFPTTTPNAYYQFPSVGNVIPDGNGGALATSLISTGTNEGSTQVTDIGGSGATATISNFSSSYHQPDMVLGDQGTYFLTDGNQIVDVNEASGSGLWRWQPSSGTVQIIAATAGGGVAVKNTVSNQEDVVRLDSTGISTYDDWGTIGGSAGYGVLSNSAYWNSALWIGTTPSVISGLVGTPLQVAPAVYALSGGTEQHQGASGPGLVLVAFQDCHKVSATNIFVRFPAYYLSSSTTQIKTPQQNYTVFEFIPGQKSKCTGTVSGRYNDLDPCNYGDGSALSPYNEFDDQISNGLYGGATDLRQYFDYGLPGQRLYGVKQIYRTLSGGSLQLKQPNVSWNELQDVPSGLSQSNHY